MRVWRLGSGVAVAAVVGLAFLTLAALALLPAQRAVGTSAGWVEHTFEVIARADRLLAELNGAEAAARDGLLDGDGRPAERLAERSRTTREILDELRGLVADNPDQSARVARLAAALESRLATLADVAGRAAAGDKAGAAVALTGPDARAATASLRDQALAFVAEERRLLRDRRAAADGAERAALVAVVLAALSGAASAGAAALLFVRREKRGEAERLRAERERYAAAFENAAVGMAEVGLDGRWLRVNRTLCEIVGYTPAELCAKTFQDITCPEDLDSDLHLLRRLVAGEIPTYSLEKRYLRRDGTMVPINLTVGLVRDKAGSPLYAISVIEDIAARKAAEDEVRRLNASLERQVQDRTSDLAAANHRLEAFAYTVSHDLRAPLRGMEGFARILLDDFAPGLGPKGERYAQRIVAAAERMEGLIGDLLTFSRLQLAEFQPRALDVSGLAQAAAEDARALAEGRDATIEVAQPMPEVVADPVVLGHVLSNLVANAVKFRRPDEAARVRIRAERRDGRVRVWVEDDGIGIAPEHQEKIFNVFERLHGQEAYPGTGIGLAIVKTGIERLGGTVGVVSEAGGGARFWIELPEAARAETRRHAA
ncbi:MAG: PAS domain S-box protein [Methylobacteriaceae bacterium]|nr:PAS domain S-box protein [Methylobacteriaceae bacterium]